MSELVTVPCPKCGSDRKVTPARDMHGCVTCDHEWDESARLRTELAHVTRERDGAREAAMQYRDRRIADEERAARAVERCAQAEREIAAAKDALWIAEADRDTAAYQRDQIELACNEARAENEKLRALYTACETFAPVLMEWWDKPRYSEQLAAKLASAFAPWLPALIDARETVTGSRDALAAYDGKGAPST